jgi:Protein of unknown function (DUF3147)
MLISFHPSELKKTKWSDYALRFMFGGSVSVLAAFLAKEFGPSLGGLFLAFPAIFPATATLIEKQEEQKKLRAGIVATVCGRQAVALDAAGAALGSVGLATFAIVVWQFLPEHETGTTLGGAFAAWLGMSLAGWTIRKTHFWRSAKS